MIFVDPRVGSKHLAPLFDRLQVAYDVTPLDAGDCSFFGNGPDGPVSVGIELKGGRAGADFLQSMQSGRLVDEQVPKLQRYDRRYLIIEGVRPTSRGVIWVPPRRGSRARPIFEIDIRRFVTGVEESGLRVRWTRDPQHTVDVIVKELYAFWQKPYNEHTSINTLYDPPIFSVRRESRELRRLRKIAKAFDGIGVDRSRDVALHFRSIARLLGAAEGEWRAIEGIGPKLAGDIVRAIRAEIPEVITANRSTSRVPARGRVADRGTRHSRKRQDQQLDASRSAQPGIRAHRASR